MKNSLMIFLYLVCAKLAMATQTLQMVTEHRPPNSYLNAQGQVVGKATEKVIKILQLANLDYNISLYPWARSYRIAQSKPYMGIYPIMRSAEREAQFQWVCPLVKQSALYFIKLSRRHDIVINSIDDARKYLIAASRDEFDHQYLTEHHFVENIHFKLTSGDMVNLKLLLTNRVDLLVASLDTIDSNLKQLNQPMSQVNPTIALSSTEPNPLCLAFSLKTPTAVVDKVLTALKQVDQGK